MVNLDNAAFVSNKDLEEVLSASAASPEEVQAAVTINENARIRALKASFMILAAISLLAIFPATRLPSHRSGELAEEELERERIERGTSGDALTEPGGLEPAV